MCASQINWICKVHGNFRYVWFIILIFSWEPQSPFSSSLFWTNPHLWSFFSPSFSLSLKKKHAQSLLMHRTHWNQHAQAASLGSKSEWPNERFEEETAPHQPGELKHFARRGQFSWEEGTPPVSTSCALKTVDCSYLTMSKSLFPFLCWHFVLFLEAAGYLGQIFLSTHTQSSALTHVQNLGGTKGPPTSSKTTTDSCVCSCNALLEPMEWNVFWLRYKRQKRKAIVGLEIGSKPLPIFLSLKSYSLTYPFTGVG